MSRRFCGLHLGLPKTATKTLQWNLFAHHSQIEYLGTYQGLRCRDANIQRVMDDIVWGDVFHPDLERCRKLFQASVAEARAHGRCPLWSLESLATDVPEKNRARAENLREVLGDCRVLITLRNPTDLVESTYFQVLRRENVGVNGKPGTRINYFTIEEWLRSQWDGEILPHLRYEETIAVYERLFGSHAVGVRLFEQLKEDAVGWVRSVCDLFEIDAAEGVRLMEHKHENRRWRQEQVESLGKIHRSLFRAHRFRFAPRRIRSRMLGEARGAAHDHQPAARAEIPARWRERIEAATREGNRRLARKFDLPIQNYGYPL